MYLKQISTKKMQIQKFWLIYPILSKEKSCDFTALIWSPVVENATKQIFISRKKTEQPNFQYS